MFSFENKPIEAADILRMVLNGKIAGHISEWPQLKPAMEAVLAERDAAQRELSAWKQAITDCWNGGSYMWCPSYIENTVRELLATAPK